MKDWGLKSIGTVVVLKDNNNYLSLSFLQE
jgi:ribosomal protein L30/L7E